METEHFCTMCKFFDATPSKPSELGVCHRYPRLHLQNTYCYYVDVVDEDDWCGEWKPIDYPEVKI